jgi:hypothetical protein
MPTGSWPSSCPDSRPEPGASTAIPATFLQVESIADQRRRVPVREWSFPMPDD